MSTIQTFIKDFTHILAVAHCIEPTADYNPILHELLGFKNLIGLDFKPID